MTLERVLVWCSGADYNMLRRHQQDKVTYALIGSAIVASAVLAGLAVLALLQLLSTMPLFGHIPLAFFLAAVVSVGLDHFLATPFWQMPVGLSRGSATEDAAPAWPALNCVATLIAYGLLARTADRARQLDGSQRQNPKAFFAALGKSALAKNISVEQELVVAALEGTRCKDPEPGGAAADRANSGAGRPTGTITVFATAGTCAAGDVSAADQQHQEYEATASQAKLDQCDDLVA